MADVRDADPGAVTIARAEADDLAARVAGPVSLPGDDGYTAECAIYNLNLGLEPALAVGVTSDADVQAAVGFAAERGLPVAVNHTGHHAARRGARCGADRHPAHGQRDDRLRRRTVRDRAGCPLGARLSTSRPRRGSRR